MQGMFPRVFFTILLTTCYFSSVYIKEERAGQVKRKEVVTFRRS